MNVFTRDLGRYQGRVPSSDAIEGSYVYEFGHAKFQKAAVVRGDYHQIRQMFTVRSGAKYVRPTIILRTPHAAPAAGVWEISCWLNGIKMVARRLRQMRRKLIIDDWRISLAAASPAPGTNELIFRLALIDPALPDAFENQQPPA